ncbi:hypothetical protein [Streptomyces sp. NPDC058955]
MSRAAIDKDTGEQPPPEDDRAFLGRPRGPLTLCAASIEVT